MTIETHVIDRATDSALFSPLQVGAMSLSHRIVHAPMGRGRGRESENVPGTYVPWEIEAKYYIQRATPGGMLITSALPISEEAKGGSFVGGPAMYTEDQKLAWKKVLTEIKKTGAVMVAQIWHGGRTSGHGKLPCVSSSATRIEYNPRTKQPNPPPREMTVEDIKRTIADFARSARLAIDAGFEGVEVHGANGYLCDQFLHDNINRRTDEYGGSIENRNRFVLEMVDAICAEIGSDRFGLRLAPYGFFNECKGSDRVAQWTKLCTELRSRNLAYVSFMEARYDEFLGQKEKLAALGQTLNSDDFGSPEEQSLPTIAPFRAALGGKEGTKVMVAGGYDTENCWGAVESGLTDMIAYGRYFTSNPDLVYRIRHQLPLVKYIRPLFYTYPKGQPEAGYTTFAPHESNLKTEEDKELYAIQQKNGISLVENGWQLSQDGVQ
ncbi:hypothetical protein TREMEDRAFT_31883 [Tremella mesenterica DSM 1558]|uniref:uncharacterized protein n=1 Tax=Tremella mesenterica (strain ATCC 24925 / CBS 8224 / DSM 1558 / NBRC 9311 / NRRL Y-6157 / RJB 2259-6 / UBC 559-6) TaxID=578456 RepID=UPI0003F48FCE|nr:uncharacterized protein TREMEDRAFT_31883 [Tremella mesenterica DSM 1558]EIW68702.1 hypothetical protein TREMEDRAFT_31883 [Tremella mesenterica DSM 1558]